MLDKEERDGIDGGVGTDALFLSATRYPVQAGRHAVFRMLSAAASVTNLVFDGRPNIFGGGRKAALCSDRQVFAAAARSLASVYRYVRRQAPLRHSPTL
jgi:hypothetical protein